MAKKADNIAKKNKKLKDDIKSAIDSKRVRGVPVNTGKKQAKAKTGDSGMRDEKGRIKKGHALNPNGKPKGAKHMTTLLKDALKKVAEGSDDPNDVAIVQSLISSAKAGNISAIEMVFNRIDGKQGTLVGDLGEDERVSEISITFN